MILQKVKYSKSWKTKSHLRNNTNVCYTDTKSFVDGSPQLGINNTQLEHPRLGQVGLQKGTKVIRQYSYKKRENNSRKMQ